MGFLPQPNVPTQGLGRCVRVSPRLRVYEAPTQLLVLQISRNRFPLWIFLARRVEVKQLR